MADLWVAPYFGVRRTAQRVWFRLDVKAFLYRPGFTTEDAELWTQVTDALDPTVHGGPHKPTFTPLMLDFGRRIYNPRPGNSTGCRKDPNELFPPGLPKGASVEDFLLHWYVPAAYRRHDETRRTKADPWSASHAVRWFGFLAASLAARDRLDGDRDPPAPAVTGPGVGHARWLAGFDANRSRWVVRLRSMVDGDRLARDVLPPATGAEGPVAT